MPYKKDSREQKKKEEGPVVEIGAEELEDLRKKAGERDEFSDKWLKVHADYENTRKRMEKQQNDYIKFANEEIIAKLFPIMDNFDMAFTAMEKAEDKAALMEGVKLIQKEFHKVLEDHGVKKIETSGKQFDPHFHEAVSVIETSDRPDGEILEETRAGYTLNGRLLRAAQVIIAKNEVV